MREINPSFTEASLRRAAGATSFERGEDYVRYVAGLRVDGASATASIQARRVYLVDLAWGSERLTGNCTCPHFAAGNFCKHLVALGLAVLDRPKAAAGAAGANEAGTREMVELLDIDQLREIVVELADRYPEAHRLVQVRAAASGGDPSAVSAELTNMVQDALRVRGYIDYRRSFEVATKAQDVLDELEGQLSAGAADIVRPALLKALSRLRTISLHADDSSGSIGDASQRAADLYARSCREGNPDPTKLARWLLKFRIDSPGWPETVLADFISAFDDKALAVYRKGVAALAAQRSGGDEDNGFEVKRMLLELADHDGDVDEAIWLLSGPDSVDFAAIVDRLRAVGRLDEAFDWIERAVAAGRVSSLNNGRAYWLSPEEVVEEYLARDRVEDALEIQRKEFARRPEVPRFRALLELAQRVGSPAVEREWAYALLDAKAREPFGSGAARIQIAIAERDLEGAWQAAEAHGAGHAWRELAGALAAEYPGRAAELYQPKVDEALTVADSGKYKEIAGDLALMKGLCERSGEAEDFAAYLDGIRDRYRRRPSLMAALDRRGL